MATVPASINGSPRGIANVLTGFVVESESIVDTPIQEDIDDQQGKRADEAVYDTRTDLKLTVYGAASSAAISSVIVNMPNNSGVTGKRIKYPSGTSGVYYKVDSVEEAGTYNGRRRWIIAAHKYENFPPQGA